MVHPDFARVFMFPIRSKKFRHLCRIVTNVRDCQESDLRLKHGQKMTTIIYCIITVTEAVYRSACMSVKSLWTYVQEEEAGKSDSIL